MSVNIVFSIGLALTLLSVAVAASTVSLLASGALSAWWLVALVPTSLAGLFGAFLVTGLWRLKL